MERFLVHWKVFLKQIGNFNVICSFGSLDESKYFFEMCERKYKQPSFTDGHNTGYNWNKAVLARWKEGNQVSDLNIFINNYRQGLLASCSFLPSAKGSVRARERGWAVRIKNKNLFAENGSRYLRNFVKKQPILKKFQVYLFHNAFQSEKGTIGDR